MVPMPQYSVTHTLLPTQSTPCPKPPVNGQYEPAREEMTPMLMPPAWMASMSHHEEKGWLQCWCHQREWPVWASKKRRDDSNVDATSVNYGVASSLSWSCNSKKMDKTGIARSRGLPRLLPSFKGKHLNEPIEQDYCLLSKVSGDKLATHTQVIFAWIPPYDWMIGWTVDGMVFQCCHQRQLWFETYIIEMV